MQIPIGQEKIANSILTAIKNNKLNHSYIIEGEQGIGKKTFAHYVCNLIMCTHGSACGECDECKYTNLGTNPDILSISNDDKSVISIDKVRVILKEVYLKPSICDKKIFIIYNAHLMNANAQNALLKVIEEPPKYAVFLFICDNLNLMLPTIISRSQIIKIHPLKKEDITKIVNIEADNEFLLNYCSGNIGKIKSLLYDESFKDLRNTLFDKLLLLLDLDDIIIYSIASYFEQNKQYKDIIFDLCSAFFRDVLFKKLSIISSIANKDKMTNIDKFSEYIDQKQCIKIIDIIKNTQKEMGKYGNYNLSVITMFMSLWEEIHD